MKPFPILGERQIVASGRFLSLTTQSVTMPGGAVIQYEIATRRRVAGIVAVAPLTTDEHTLFIEQYRIPLGRPIIELPAGLCDIDGEDPIETVRRELAEETGHTCSVEHVTHVARFPTSAGLTDEIVDGYVAREVSRILDMTDVAHDATESIRVIPVPLRETDEFLMSRASSGMLVDAKAFALIFFLRKMIESIR